MRHQHELCVLIPNRIPGAAFASNAHVGALVLQLCAEAQERRDEDERCARLIVRKARCLGQESDSTAAVCLACWLYSRSGQPSWRLQP